MTGDRFSAMTWDQDGPCERCGLHPSGIATYAPTDGKALPADVVERQLAFSDTRGPGGGPQ